MPMPIRVEPTEIPDVLLIHTGKVTDERGYFSECFSQRVWGQSGFNEVFVQDNLSCSRRGVLRGMHYQILPYGMGKLVRCIRGGIFDVAVDLRRGSPTFGRWVARKLTEENGCALWVPVGFAHGFLTLHDDTLVYYKCTEHHVPEAERSLAWNCAEVGITWPFEPTLISPKDAAAPSLSHAEMNFVYADATSV
jgi:dTDP-4-dehydrorhamnose 3,5-epimerase